MGSAANPLGGAPGTNPASSFDNNLYLLGQNQQQNQGLLNPQGAANVTSASGNLDTAATQLKNVAAYDTGILSGNRETVLATEAPEISSMLASYNQQRQAAGQLQPRGGGRSAFLNEQPYKELGDVNKLIESARPAAAKDLTSASSALTGVANAESYLGTAEEQLAANNVSTSLNFLLGKSGVQLQSAQLTQQNGAALGASIAQLLPLLTAGAGA